MIADRHARIRLADAIRDAKPAVAQAVTDDFCARHPEWASRYGARGRRLSTEDGAYHLEFLAGAIEMGSPSGFDHYIRWTERVLGARMIGPDVLRESLELLRARLLPRLPADLCATAASYLDLAVAVVGAPAEDEPATPGDVVAADRRVFVQALLQGDRRAATAVALEALDRGVSVVELYGGVFQAAMYEIGRLWESNQITVAQEHMATAMAQSVVAHAYARLPLPDPVRGNVIITGVRGELHHLGARLIADVLEAAGWRVRFLGSDLPRRDIAAAVAEHRAVAVGISATMLSSTPEVRDVIADLRSAHGRRVPIIVGGAAFRISPDLVAEVDADGAAADVREALDVWQALAPA
jgi:MerR family transcriptional regulator, light-induced transcriptional regulator